MHWQGLPYDVMGMPALNTMNCSLTENLLGWKLKWSLPCIRIVYGTARVYVQWSLGPLQRSRLVEV